MIAISDIPENELLLARLAGGKLAKLLGGMLSVGLSSLQLDSPESFLAGRNKLIMALVEILCHTGVRPGSASSITLNERTTSLSGHVDDFFSNLLALADWRNMTTEQLELTTGQLATTYSTSLTALQDLLQDLDSPVNYSQQQMKGRELINGLVTDFYRKPKGGSVQLRSAEA